MHLHRVLALALLLTGCAYREAMQRGQEASDRQDWPAAVAAYQAAHREDPDDQPAAEALKQARRRWHTRALSRFEIALAGDELGEAALALAEADQAGPDEPATTIARKRLQTARHAREAGALRADSEKASKSGDLRGAFRLVAQAESLHSTPDGQRMWVAARARVVEQAAADEAAGRFSAALSLHEAIAGVEPAHEGQVGAFRSRWADHERGRGEAAGKAIGPAFLHFARAAALAGQPGDAAQRDALRREILRDTAPVIEGRFSGPPERKSRLAAALSALQNPPLDARSPRLVVEVVPDATTCSQSKLTRSAEGEYVAGTRDVANPDWARARDEVQRLRDAVRRAEDDEIRARNTLRDAEERLERVFKERREQRERDREQATRDLDRVRDDERRALEYLRQAQDRRDEGAIRHGESEVDRTRREVERAFQALDDVQNRHRGGHEDSERDRAREQQQRAEEELRRDRDRLTEAERVFGSVPPTREEPRYATHRYAVHHWERVCRGGARLVITAGDLEPRASELAAKATTQDRSYEAQLPLGLDEDPLEFPEDDTRLMGQVDDSLAIQIAKGAESLRETWAATLGDRALTQGDTPEATRLAIASILLNPVGARPGIKRLLAEKYQLDDFGILLAEGR